ncbi:MAG: LrgB family protein [Bacilli bacterium]
MMFLFCSATTIAVYLLSRILMKRYPSPFTTPVFFSTVVLISLFVLLDVDATDYTPTKNVLTSLLGPATVALSVPLYRNRAMVATYWKRGGLSLLLGLTASIAASELVLRALDANMAMIGSMRVKSVTVPIALEIIPFIGGDPALTTAFVVATGILGTMFAPLLMNALGVTNGVTRGLVLGGLSHGQGTAQAATEDELNGAVAGVAMGMSAIVCSFILPLLF